MTPLPRHLINTWRGLTRSDGFNRLILASRLHWREVKLLRAYSQYLQQTGIPFSLEYMAATLARHPLLARLLVELFEAMFDPDRERESDYRRELEPGGWRVTWKPWRQPDQSDPVLLEYLARLPPGAPARQPPGTGQGH